MSPALRRLLPARRAIGMLLVLVAAGCGKLDRVGECRQLVKTVNPALDAIEAQVKKNHHDGYRAAAVEYARLVEKLRAQPHAARGAKELAEEYASTFAEAPPRLNEYAAALRDGNAGKREAAQRELERISQREAMIAARITSYCAGR